MKIQNIRLIYLWRMGLFFFFALSALFFMHWLGQPYEQVLQQLLAWAGKQGEESWLLLLRERLFPPAYWQLLPWLIGLLFVAALGLFLYLWKQSERHLRLGLLAWRRAGQLMNFGFGTLRPVYVFLLLLFLLRAFYNFFSFALQYDECWSYVHHSSRGFFFSLLAPHNNHPLYSALASISSSLPIDLLYSLRLPALLFAFLSLFSGALALRSFGLSQQRHLLAWILLVFSAPLCFYGLYARGYSALLFFFFAASWLLQEMLNRPRNRVVAPLYILALTLAVLSNLAALAALLGLASYALLAARNYSERLFLLRLHGQAAFLALLLLAPQLFAGLLRILYQATQTDATDAAWYWRHVANWFWAGYKYEATPSVLLAALLLALVLHWRAGRRKQFFFLLSFFTIPFVFAFFGIYAPERFWVFLLLPLSLALASLIPSRLWLAPLLCLAALYYSQIHGFLHWSAAYDWEIRSLSKQYIAEGQSIYVYPHYQKPCMQCYYLQQTGHLPELYSPHTNSGSYSSLEESQAYWVLENLEQAPSESDSLFLRKHYEPIYTSAYLRLWRRS